MCYTDYELEIQVEVHHFSSTPVAETTVFLFFYSSYILFTIVLSFTSILLLMLWLLGTTKDVKTMTNFYPIHVYVSNYRMYSSLEKANFSNSKSKSVTSLFAVLNLREIKSLKMNLFIYDIDINSFHSMKAAVTDCEKQMNK